VGISLTATAGTAYYIPVNVEDGLDEKEVIEVLRPLFEDSHILKIAHNYKFDFMMLKRAGLEV
ncbi:MAG TPA: hypothetical protein DD671_04165, partial [Balneolaceae bacterium]|nr:hypothetical protein [Balneolaceae bacterium]